MAAARDMRASGVYGSPPRGLVEVPAEAMQLSPLVPRSQAIEDLPDRSVDALIVAAPPGTIERRYTLAQAIRVARPGARLVALAPRDKGGARIARELAAFGAEVREEARRHYRIALALRPGEPVGLGEAIAAGAPRLVPALGLWTQPGIFSWERVDAGSALLAAQLPQLEGSGADLGCGTGYLASELLAASPRITTLMLVDLDRRAIRCAERNVRDPRAKLVWADVRDLAVEAAGLDFVVMNPPFHDGGAEDRALGSAFIRRAAEVLRPGGRCWLVANRHLPYEAVLRQLFGTVRQVVEQAGYKVFEAAR